MKLQTSTAIAVPLVLTLAVGATGCAAIGGIFKAGVWVGVLAVFGVVGLLIWGIKSLIT